MCFVRAWKTGFLAIAIAEILSQKMEVGEDCSSYSSAASRRIQMTSEVAAERERYSASVDDLATVTFFLTDHDIRFGPKNVQKPETDFRSVLSDAQSASV